MARVTVQIVVRQRWWLQWYLLGLWACSRMTGLQPDPAKVEPRILRGLVAEERTGDVTCAM